MKYRIPAKGISFLKKIRTDGCSEFTDLLAAPVARTTSAGMQLAARNAAARLRIAGLSDVKVHQVVADGIHAVNGNRAHLNWDIAAASLELDGTVLVAYRQDMSCVEPYSPATRKGGVTAKLKYAHDETRITGPVKGMAVVLGSIKAPLNVVSALKARGAAAVICPQAERTGRLIGTDAVDISTGLLNSPFKGGDCLPVFRVAGPVLKKLKAAAGTPVSFTIDAKTSVGTVPVVTARLAGWEKYDIYLADVHASCRPVLRAPAPGMPPYAIDLEKVGEVALAAEVGLGAGRKAVEPAAYALGYVTALAGTVKKNELRRSVRIYLSFGHNALNHYLNGSYATEEGARAYMYTSLHVAPAAGTGPSATLYSCTETAGNYQELVATGVAKTAGIRSLKMEPGISAVTALTTTVPTNAPAPVNSPAFMLEAGGSMKTNKAVDAFTGLLFWMANAGYKEARALAKDIFEAAPKNGGAGWARKRFVHLPRLSETGYWCLTPARRQKMQKDGLYVKGYLFRRVALESDIQKWMQELTAAVPARAKKGAVKRAAGTPVVPLVPGMGPVGFDTLNAAQLKKLGTLLPAGTASVPLWMNRAAALALGKKPVEVLEGMVGMPVPKKALPLFYETLKDAGMARYRKIVTEAQIKSALRRAGLKKGDTVMCHVGLMTYGYVPGGPKMVIKCLMDAVGEQGTIFMPAHSLSWVGNLPFNPQTSNGIAGVITNIFRTMPGVKRSLHPTHSVAGYGPMAEKMLAGHDETMGPFDKRGFWGKFYKNNCKILLFCNDKLANTFLHCVDVWNGAAMPTIRCHYMRGGKRHEVNTPEWPFYGDAFKYIYGPMWKKNQITEVNLGEDTVYAMRAKDAFKAGAPIIRKDPLKCVPPQTNDYYSRYMRREIAKRRKGTKK